jgi:hypothetical protein
MELESSCYRCGASQGVKLTSRNERAGCIVSPTTYCQPCDSQIDAERKAREYAAAHFCSNCNIKYKRPYSKNRKYLRIGSDLSSYTVSLCPSCFDSELARMPVKNKENESFWLEPPVRDIKNS